MTARTLDRVPFRRRLLARLAAIGDGGIIRFAFFGMLIGTLCVLYVDYRELNAADVPVFATPMLPLLPARDPSSSDFGPVPQLTTAWDLLEAPLTITLTGGGLLQLTGTIDIGAFDRFLAEIDARGEYVTTVALDSPGGSVSDAIAIGSVIRARGLSTSVADGALCASSCPLILAAGVERRAAPQAAIGVHQIYATTPSDALTAVLRDAVAATSEAQSTTALITRYLTDMGIDPALWLHALETPPQSLYYLTLDELAAYRLATLPVTAELS